MFHHVGSSVLQVHYKLLIACFACLSMPCHFLAAPEGHPLSHDIISLPQEFDANTDSRISFDEFNSALSRWVEEKITVTTQSLSDAEANGARGLLPGGMYSSMLDPSTTAATAVLADLPPDDLAALQVKTC
jgi:hypothetical protein